MKTEVHLPKGTKVLHGTCVSHLQSILSSGLQPGHSRHELRALTEPLPKVPAVYVGGPSAYFGAWAAAGAFLKEYEAEELSLPLLGNAAGSSPKDLATMVFASPPLAVPVVLAVELAEDTNFIGDEDFFVRKFAPDGSEFIDPLQNDESVWAIFRSGGLIREGGIPPTWITSMQFPQLLRIDHVSHNHETKLMDDCLLLAAGIYQNQQRLPAAELPYREDLWKPSIALSQSRPFTRSAVSDLLAMRHLEEPANLLFNLLKQIHLTTYFGQNFYSTKFHGE